LGNPYDPEVYYQFVQAIKGMGEACRKFDTPVTGGNVSFYNQSAEGDLFIQHQRLAWLVYWKI
jgi:phosphoribosylformylglycinamidine synthase